MIKYKTLIVICLQIILSASLLAQNSPLIDRKISIDFYKEKGQLSTTYNECIGAGRANEGLRADWQEQLRTIQKNINFRYIRFHGLLSDDMGVYSEDANGNSIYNWQYIDALYDFLLSVHIKPFVELSFMPDALKSDTKTVFWWKGNVSRPKSEEKWQALIKNLVQHFENRYGKNEVEQWYFEVWNEPNLPYFFNGEKQDYLRLYEITAQSIKSVSNSYRVGGPASAGVNWVNDLIEYCTTKRLPLDFIAVHTYSSNSFFDEFGKRAQRLNKDPDAVFRSVIKAADIVKRSAMPHLKVFFTEWNSSPSPRDPVHDTYQNASLILNALKKTGDMAAAMSYWTFTDIFEEAGPPTTSFHGGFGLLNLQGIKKPSYFAYSFMNQLAKTELQNMDSSSWVCKGNDGSVTALLWDYTLPADTVSNQIYFNKEQPSKNKGSVLFDIQKIPDGEYNLLVYKVGYQQNDAFTLYNNLGKPYNLSAEQVLAIKQATSGMPVIQKNILVSKKQFQQSFAMRENDIFFIKLQPR